MNGDRLGVRGEMVCPVDLVNLVHLVYRRLDSNEHYSPVIRRRFLCMEAGEEAPLLTIRSSADYPFGMELPDLKDDPHLKVLRPLVEAYLAFWRIDIRHIKSLRLTPSQFDVIATLGDTKGMTCSELSAHTLVTKGTLTGVLDRLVSKGLIRRDAMTRDRRCTNISLTAKGDALFRKTYAAHLSFLRPFFKRALNPEEADQARELLLRLRDSFQQES